MKDSRFQEVIGGYELVRPLGQGGMAEVWLARKAVGEKGEKYLAIKLIAEHFSSDERYVRMFRAEAELAASLNHANIVQVFDYGVDGGRSYLVMEWVDGLNLLKLGERLAYVEEQRRFRLVSYIVGQLLHALHYAHCIRSVDGHPLGMVHRDVSPQNVLVSNNGEVKLTDFGVAHHNFEESSGMHVKGKVRYMPPEQLSGRSRSPCVDLYAVGAVLHELLDGAKFRGAFEDGQDLFTVVLSGHIPPLSQPVPPALDHLRLALLERDPARRLQTAEEALGLLRRFPGYGDAREELSKLCGSATGVVHPRVGPGQSSPAPAAAEPPRARPALARPKLQAGPKHSPPPPPPPLARVTTGPITAATTAVKRRDDARATPGAWITGQTEFMLLPTTPAANGPGPGRVGEPLTPSGGAPLHLVVAPGSDAGTISTDPSIMSPAVVDDGSVTQRGWPVRAHPLRSSSSVSMSWPLAVVSIGLLLVSVAGISIFGTLWLFGGDDDERAPKEAVSRTSEESAPVPGSISLLPRATAAPGIESEVPRAEPKLHEGLVAKAAIDESDVEVESEVEEAHDPPAKPSRAEPRTPSKPARPGKAVVKIRASSGLEAPEVKLGSQVFSADPEEHTITAGRRPVKWRDAASGRTWRSKRSYDFRPGKRYVVYIAKDGPHIRLEG